MASAQTEPSMDEILASIRRIISEEDDSPQDVPVARKLETLQLREEAEEAAEDGVAEEAKGGEPAAQLREVKKEEPQPEPASEPEGAKGEAEPLDDFEPMPEEPASAEASMEPAAVAHDEGETHDDTFDAPEEAPVAKSSASAQAPKQDVTEAIRPAVMAAATEQLSVSPSSARQASAAFGTLEENVRLSAGSGRTIEDLVEAMLTPMIAGWLDDNLPRIVEEKVEEEVRRIARRR